MRRALARVIVPCYRYGHLLEGCLDSVLAQEGVDVRVLVIDDASPDRTAEVAARVARRDRRVEVRRHERNAGLIATANEGLAWAADSDCLLLLSADDLLAPGALWRAASVLARHPSVGLVYGRAPYFGPGRTPRVPRRWRGTRVWEGRSWLERRCRTAHNCISSPEAVVRSSVQLRVGGYDPACTHASDLNMWLRIAAVSDVAYVKGAAQALYRVHPDSMLRSSADPLLDLDERRLAFERFLAGPGRELEDAERLRASYRRALARQALWQASRAWDRGALEREPYHELIAFALDVCPEARRLREWQGLRARRALGPGRSLYFPLFLVTGAGHRLRVHATRARRYLQGV